MSKKNVIMSLLVISIIISCKKNDDEQAPVTTPVTTQDVLIDFAAVIANPNYKEIETRALILNDAIIDLGNSTNDQNLFEAQEAWRAVRVPWEQAEGYLFGPAEDYNYDPSTDSWPVNTTELDSLLASSNPLQLENIDSLQYSLKGYHPIEYLLFGVGGTRTAAQLTSREILYLTSLSQSLVNITTQLRKSWDPAEPNNFTQQLITAGSGSTRYLSKKDAFLTIVNAMNHICNEVANNKMEVPLVAHDSELVESQYAHNATLDFKNNMIGVQNVYLCRYTTTGKSLHDLVAAKDASLDNTIRAQISAAVNSFDALNPNYGIAIFNQQGQIHATQNAINNVEGGLNLLTNFVQANITD